MFSYLVVISLTTYFRYLFSNGVVSFESSYVVIGSFDDYLMTILNKYLKIHVKTVQSNFSYLKMNVHLNLSFHYHSVKSLTLV